MYLRHLPRNNYWAFAHLGSLVRLDAEVPELYTTREAAVSAATDRGYRVLPCGSMLYNCRG